MKISLITPSRGRAAQLERYLDSFWTTALRARPVELESIVVLDGDREGVEVAVRSNSTVLFSPDQRGAVRRWNEGLALAPNSDAYILGADDLIWHPDWLNATLDALALLPNQSGMVGFNDLTQWQKKNQLASHWLITRRCLHEVMGGVMAIPSYYHYWFDPEMNERAQIAGCWVIATNAVVEHRNCFSGGASPDATYQSSATYFEQDQLTYQWRKANNYPLDWTPIV
jgi:GT2 family glycosyltransferase